MKNSNRKQKMRHLVVLVSCFVMLGLAGIQSSACANPPPNEDPEARIDKRMEEMTEALSLTETQQTDIRVIMVNMDEEIEALRGSGQGRQRPDREKMEALHEKYDEQIEEELTSEQQALFKIMLESGKRQNQNNNGRKPRRDK